MAAKKKNIDAIEYNGTEYHMAFNLNVMEQIQEEFGSLDEWGKLTSDNGHGEPDIKALKFGLGAMLNEGIEIDNERGADLKPLTERQVGRLISTVGLAAIADQLGEVVAAAMPETDPKN